MKLSIVTPLWNEEEMVPLLRERLTSALKDFPADHEIILVNDGSNDQTAQKITTWIAQDPHIVLINLTRNFGHQAAITAGLKETTGDAVVILDADLQDPPELIAQLWDKWREGYKVVLAERRSRDESFVRKLCFRTFYRLFSFFTDSTPVTSGVFGLMDRKVVNHLLSLTEQNRFLPGLRHWVGYHPTTVSYDRQARAKGRAKQSFSRLLKYSFDAIFSFSYKPLRFSFLCGFFISIGCFFYGLKLVVQRILQIDIVHGFTTIAVAILFLCGVILMSIGIMGEYIGRIYDEVKKRPLYLVASKVFRDSQTGALTEIDGD